MPQLDLMHFFSQFFWFSIGFTFLYVSVLHNTVKSIFINLKFRKIKIESLTTSINDNYVVPLFRIYDSFVNTYTLTVWKVTSLRIIVVGLGFLLFTIKKFNNNIFFSSNKSLLIAITGAHKTRV
jgi:hypothetical protein